MLYTMKILQLGAELFHVDGQDMTKLIADFRSFMRVS